MSERNFLQEARRWLTIGTIVAVGLGLVAAFADRNSNALPLFYEYRDLPTSTPYPTDTPTLTPTRTPTPTRTRTEAPTITLRPFILFEVRTPTRISATSTPRPSRVENNQPGFFDNLRLPEMPQIFKIPSEFSIPSIPDVDDKVKTGIALTGAAFAGWWLRSKLP